MNFVIIPALIGPLLGPTVGGLIVHWLTWRYILFVNVPVGLLALWMMPAAAAAMFMKFISSKVLARFGYRRILIVNTVMIVLLSLTMGFFNSLQYTSMNSMAFADIDTPDSSMASTIVNSMQQMSMSFGLACGSLIAGWYLGDLPPTNPLAVSLTDDTRNFP